MRKLLLISILFLVSVSGVFAQSCSERPVTVEHHTIPSDPLHGELSFDVYVPPCMDERIIGGYPVIYLLHGQDMGIEVWKEMGMDKVIRDVLAGGEFPLFLTVVPQEDQYLLSPSLSGFQEAVLQDLIPWVDSHYPVCKNRSCRAVGGLSRGALWAEKLAFEHADLFGSLAMLSTPGGWIDQQSLYFLAESHKPDHLLRIRIDSGSEDSYRHEAAKVSSDLTFIGYPYEYNIQPGEHDVEYWKSMLPEYFIWFSEGWKDLSLL